MSSKFSRQIHLAEVQPEAAAAFVFSMRTFGESVEAISADLPAASEDDADVAKCLCLRSKP